MLGNRLIEFDLIGNEAEFYATESGIGKYGHSVALHGKEMAGRELGWKDRQEKRKNATPGDGRGTIV